MARIEPFRAFRYDLNRVLLRAVATQPYDKITPEMQDRYYAASPYNLVRIILGKPEPSDNSDHNVYTRSANYFRTWQQEGVLRQDSEPSIYRYLQQFSPPGQNTPLQLERQGFIALGKIEDYATGIVFRHEQTLSKPKADRLDLLRATRAHFGQIFMLYSDPAGGVERTIATTEPPDMQMHDEYGVLHRLWCISDPETITAVRDLMREKKLIIADGHHRYETALTYRNERKAEQGPGGSAKGSRLSPIDFAMMTFVKMESPGLLILPTHRVVHGLTNFSADQFRSTAAKFFSVEEADPDISAERATAILKEAGHTGTAILAVTRESAFLLDRPATPKEIFRNTSLRLQGLDVVQLHRCLLEQVLGISEDAIRKQINVTYVRDADEALAAVRGGEADIVFLMNPVGIEQMRDIAFAGEVLPQKSTDFYPKLLSGLTIYALE